MQLGEIRHIKQCLGEKIHLYVIKPSGKRMLMYIGYTSMMFDSLDDRKILRMSYDMNRQLIEAEIAW